MMVIIKIITCRVKNECLFYGNIMIKIAMLETFAGVMWSK